MGLTLKPSRVRKTVTVAGLPQTMHFGPFDLLLLGIVHFLSPSFRASITQMFAS